MDFTNIVVIFGFLLIAIIIWFAMNKTNAPPPTPPATMIYQIPQRPLRPYYNRYNYYR